jgi:hypothetical protein
MFVNAHEHTSIRGVRVFAWQFVILLRGARLCGAAATLPRRPMIVIYAVATENPTRAEERTATQSTDEKIEAVGPIRWDILTDRFELKDEQFTHL